MLRRYAWRLISEIHRTQISALFAASRRIAEHNRRDALVTWEFHVGARHNPMSRSCAVLTVQYLSPLSLTRIDKPLRLNCLLGGAACSDSLARTRAGSSAHRPVCLIALAAIRPRGICSRQRATRHRKATNSIPASACIGSVLSFNVLIAGAFRVERFYTDATRQCAQAPLLITRRK
jgi:hypothetical protein